MFKCYHCEKEFKTTHARNSHLKVHNKNYKKPSWNIPDVKCQYCNKSITKSSIKKHEVSCMMNPINYKECPVCDKQIKPNRNFCSKTCSATYTNHTRRGNEFTAEMKEEFKNPTPKITKYPSCKLFEHTCSQCGKFRLVNYKENQRKTCSKECQIIASTSRTYQNGSRKTFKYFNEYQNKEVTLESSWEVQIAELLDKYNIEWHRPKPIKWIDSKDKTRMYYPDFYLPKTDLFLDPKNPYCMELDKEKMFVVSKDINIIYGDVQNLVEYIQSNRSDLN